MKISTKGRYALRLMVDLAVHREDGYIPIRTISLRQEISEKYLEQIITSLSRAGLVKSVRGSSGGYALSKKADDYSVGEILRATEGSLAPVACVAEDGCCEKMDYCVTSLVWERLYDAVNSVVNNITLEDLAQRQKELGTKPKQEAQEGE